MYLYYCERKFTDLHEIQHDYVSYVDDHSVSFFYVLYDFLGILRFLEVLFFLMSSGYLLFAMTHNF